MEKELGVDSGRLLIVGKIDVSRGKDTQPLKSTSLQDKPARPLPPPISENPQGERGGSWKPGFHLQGHCALKTTASPRDPEEGGGDELLRSKDRIPILK